MLADSSAVRTYFAKLGFEAEIADIYLALYAQGPQSISELSRNSKVERTRIYRLIDTLLESNLIELETHHKRGIIKAAPISNLHILISQKEQELKALQDGLGLIEQVMLKNSLSNPATRVQFYQGPEGIRQIFWNILRAKGNICSIVNDPMQNCTGDTFWRRWAERWNEPSNTKTNLLLANEHFIQANNDWNRKHAGTPCQNMETRMLNPNVMPIKFNTDIYDDTVAYYDWHNGEIFGIEIYNKDIADAQRTFFNTLWPNAKRAELYFAGTEGNDN